MEKIAQKTEDLVGPYELHDFYLYYILDSATVRARFTAWRVRHLTVLMIRKRSLNG